MMDEIMKAQNNGVLREMRKASEDPRVTEAGAGEPLIMLVRRRGIQSSPKTLKVASLNNTMLTNVVS